MRTALLCPGRRVRLTLLLILAVATPARIHATPARDSRCFDVPGIVDCIEGRFRQFWEQNGGLAVFGYPITPAGISPAGDGRLLVQYFERVRFEYHPELASPYDVLLGRMGDERLRALNLDWQTLPAALPETPHFVPDTRHAIAHEPFWQHWQNHGLQDPGKSPYERSLALFGFPISEPSIETNATGDVVLTQWFERARFEDHGANGVLLGLLGAESRPTQSLEPAPVPPPIPEPAPPPVPVPPPAPSPPKAGGNVVYLTFDDGPFGGWTQQILTVLARYNARATFFVIGRQVPAFSGLIQGAAAAGHTFANHTYNHATLVGISRDTFQREVLSTEAVLGPYATKCLRPPGGAMDAAAHAYAAELGYRTLLWDIDPRDWQRPGAAAIADHVLRNTGSGSVVLLHDGGGDRSQTVAALDTILRTLTARGYRFEPIC